jgi:hypothetical protein
MNFNLETFSAVTVLIIIDLFGNLFGLIDSDIKKTLELSWFELVRSKIDFFNISMFFHRNHSNASNKSCKSIQMQ